MSRAYRVRRAEETDLPAVLELYRQARSFMASRGNPNQWGKDKPLCSQTEKDLAEGHLYVICEEKTIRGVFALIPGEDPTYRVIVDGSWRSQSPYCTIHRVAGDGSGGIFAAAAAYGLQVCTHLRVDTHEDNLPMQKAILAAGFQPRGIIYLADGSPRIAYDLV